MLHFFYFNREVGMEGILVDNYDVGFGESIYEQPAFLDVEYVADEELAGLIRPRSVTPKRFIRQYLDSQSKPYSVAVKYVVIHATASHQTFTAQGLQDWFLRPKAQGGLGWSRGGYHVMIEPSGKVVRLHPNETHTNGVLPFVGQGIKINNQNSIHISWIGGIDRRLQPIDNRTEAQKKMLKAVLEWYIANGLDLVFLGHNQVENKPCPCFDHVTWLREEFPYLPENQIYTADPFGYLAKMRKK